MARLEQEKQGKRYGTQLPVITARFRIRRDFRLFTFQLPLMTPEGIFFFIRFVLWIIETARKLCLKKQTRKKVNEKNKYWSKFWFFSEQNFKVFCEFSYVRFEGSVRIVRHAIYGISRPPAISVTPFVCIQNFFSKYWLSQIANTPLKRDVLFERCLSLFYEG